MDDFADVLLVFAYERQRACDNGNAPFYLGYLQELANARRSEALGLKVAEILSDGEVTHWDVNSAYQYFNVDDRWGDEAVIGAFQSRLADAPRVEAEARQHLRVIGIARRSEAIKAVASKSQLLVLPENYPSLPCLRCLQQCLIMQKHLPIWEPKRT